MPFAEALSILQMAALAIDQRYNQVAQDKWLDSRSQLVKAFLG